ncbi:MAG: hypothetical protein AAGM84_01585 [Pseudomonadota bacterium]
MRDDSARWHPPGSSAFDAPGVSVREVSLARQTMVSGTMVLSTYSLAIGWPDVALGEAYALCMRRDRVLLVNAGARRDGFDPDTSEAVSDMTDGFAVLALSGPRALECLQAGAALDPAQPSRSAFRRVFGTDVLLYRHGDESTFRIHVPRADLAAFAAALHAAAKD